jgi:DsbC/DsbD-like thiol-disulfide interchange protein
MTPRQFTGLTVLSASLLLALGQSSPAQIRKSVDAVKVKATAGKPDADGKQVVTLELQIAPKFYIYANPVGNEIVESAQTTVTLTGKGKLEKVEYPPGKVKKEKTGDLKIYKDKVTIKATVQRAKGDTGPLELGIKVQACDESRCLLPGTIKVSVP